MYRIDICDLNSVHNIDEEEEKREKEGPRLGLL